MCSAAVWFGVLLTMPLLVQLVDNLGSLKIKEKLTPQIMARIEDIMGYKPEPPRVYR